MRGDVAVVEVSATARKEEAEGSCDVRHNPGQGVQADLPPGAKLAIASLKSGTHFAPPFLTG